MIQRAVCFSPNSVEKDWAILKAVGSRLLTAGHQVEIVSEEDIWESSFVCEFHKAQVDNLLRVHPQYVFSMARLPETLSWLETLPIRVINPPQGVKNCARCRLQIIMERLGTPMPPKKGPDGYWLKRGDEAAQSKDDVVFAENSEVLKQAIATMEQRGIKDYTVSAHVKGDLVKFYGVYDSGFFRYYYPTDDGQTKFEDECRNGLAHHYPFDVQTLQGECEHLAEAVGVEVYGGDAIVRADGSFCLIDFNDWPSFSRCCEEAADAIASLIKVKKKK